MEVFERIGNYFATNGVKLAFTICLLVIGICIMLLLNTIIKKLLLKTPMDNAVISFITSIFKVVFLLILILICASIMELDTASLVVSLSTFALAVGLALKDSFSNFANGILIIVNKPFKSGDHVKIGGIEGKVWNIKLLTVELVTFDNTKIVLPNSMVLTNDIVNYSAFPVRRVDMTFSVSYGEDMDKVEATLKGVISANELISKNLDTAIFMSAQSASSIDYTIKVWTNNDDYATVKNGLYREVYEAFKREKIEIPYNQLDVHIDDKRA